MRVLVCGGRNYSADRAFNWLGLNLEDAIISRLGLSSVQIGAIIHGGACGADEGAADWGESERCEVLAFPANWKKHGKAAGPIRNRQMLENGKPDIVVAFPGGRGTANMVSLARGAGVPVIEVPE